MKPTPRGWPRITTSLFYEDASKAIDWLCRVFGFQIRLKVEGEGGRIEHSELTFGDDGMIMVGAALSPRRDRPVASPRSVGGKNTQAVMVFVDDVDAFCAKARAEGAKVHYEPATSDYGEDYWVDRSCELEDLEGHRWCFVQRLRGKG